jgi:hypothetical protein
VNVTSKRKPDVPKPLPRLKGKLRSTVKKRQQQLLRPPEEKPPMQRKPDGRSPLPRRAARAVGWGTLLQWYRRLAWEEKKSWTLGRIRMKRVRATLQTSTPKGRASEHRRRHAEAEREREG